MQVFLSSTYRDLIEHRRRVADAIDRLGHRILRMETFGARPEEATAASLSDVDACDIFIGVYGHRYGLIPEGSSFSITELEFDHACEKGKPILAFIVDLDYDCPEDGIEAEPEKSRLRAFHDKVQKSLVRDLFSSPEDLAVRVATSISRFLQQSRYATPDVKELTTVLELRKHAVIRMMEHAKQRALKSLRSGRWGGRSLVTEEELVSHLDSMKSLFVDLHSQNVTALLRGQFLVSHELTSQIHILLWMRGREIFWEALPPTGWHYCRDVPDKEFDIDGEEIARIYPEEPFDDTHPTQNTDATRGIMKARVRSDGWTRCPFCNMAFQTLYGYSWDGERHTSCKTRLDLLHPSESPDDATEQ